MRVRFALAVQVAVVLVCAVLGIPTGSRALSRHEMLETVGGECGECDGVQSENCMAVQDLCTKCTENEELTCRLETGEYNPTQTYNVCTGPGTGDCESAGRVLCYWMKNCYYASYSDRGCDVFDACGASAPGVICRHCYTGGQGRSLAYETTYGCT
jgi:hypothetical protein